MAFCFAGTSLQATHRRSGRLHPTEQLRALDINTTAIPAPRESAIRGERLLKPVPDTGNANARRAGEKVQTERVSTRIQFKLLSSKSSHVNPAATP